MLRITIDVNGRPVHTVLVHNDGTGDEKIGNYDVSDMIPPTRGWAHLGRVQGFSRRRGPVALAKQALMLFRKGGL